MITREELEAFRSDIIPRMKVFANTPVTQSNVSDRLATGIGLVIDVFGGIYNELMYMNERQEPIREFLYKRFDEYDEVHNVESCERSSQREAYKESKARFENKVGGTD